MRVHNVDSRRSMQASDSQHLEEVHSLENPCKARLQLGVEELLSPPLRLFSQPRNGVRGYLFYRA